MKWKINIGGCKSFWCRWWGGGLIWFNRLGNIFFRGVGKKWVIFKGKKRLVGVDVLR